MGSFQKEYRKVGLTERQAVIKKMEEFVVEAQRMFNQLEE